MTLLDSLIEEDVDKAKEAGYTVTVIDKAGLSCIAQPGQGAMGIHLLNPTLLDDKIDADQPGRCTARIQRTSESGAGTYKTK